jgi:hypothetical protein
MLALGQGGSSNEASGAKSSDRLGSRHFVIFETKAAGSTRTIPTRQPDPRCRGGMGKRAGGIQAPRRVRRSYAACRSRAATPRPCQRFATCPVDRGELPRPAGRPG